MQWDINVDVVIITALGEEFDALKRSFPILNQQDICRTIGIRHYYIFEFESPNKQTSMRVAFVCSEGMGRISAALAARDAIYDLRPEYIISVGIAAGDPEQIKKGYVAFAEQVVDYEIQRIGSKHEFRPEDSPCSPDFIRAAIDVMKQEWTKDIDDETLELQPEETTEIRVEKVKVACGDKIIANPNLRDRLLRELGRTRPHLSVIEMESGGICRAIFETEDKQAPAFFMIKGISDYADYSKNDKDRKFAARVAGIFLRRCLIRFMERKRTQYLVQRRRIGIEPRYERMCYLGPSKNTLQMFEQYPQDLCRGWRETMIDGAIEILFCPKGTNKYGGFEKNKIRCSCLDKEWPRDAPLDNREIRIREFAKGLIGIDKNTPGWLVDRKAAPNRIRWLVNVPTDPVLDRPELFLHFGNSDYFTVRTVTELSRRGREGTLGGITLSDIFPARWGERGKPFPKNCVPYHVSAQGVLVCQEPTTANKYLILASVNPLGSALVPGWVVTMAEQMQSPEPATIFTPWWHDFTKAFGIDPEPREERHGDTHIQDALIRGLREEFGLEEGIHYRADPKLLNICLEEDMYFITFIFFVPVEIPLEQLYSQWVNAADHKEMGLLAAYQIEGLGENGNQIDGPTRVAELLTQDRFDGGKYLIKHPTEVPLAWPWHITSRMRIYLAAYHLYGKRITEYVGLK